jgi:hypothetical protein
MNKNQLVCSEIEVGEYLYVVYIGECRLLKHTASKLTTIEEVKENLPYMKTILHLSRGGVAGLELLTKYRKYKYNLVTSREFTVLLKIPLSFVNDFCSDQKKNLIKLYMNQEIIVNDNLHKSEKFKNPSHNKIENMDEEKQFQHMIEETVKSVVKETPNEFKEMNILINNINQNLTRQITPLKTNQTVSHIRINSQQEIKHVNDKQKSIYLTLSKYNKNVIDCRKIKTTVNAVNFNRTVTKLKTSQKIQESYDTGRFDLPLVYTYIN